MQQLLEFLAHVHSLYIAHRDIKLENMMLMPADLSIQGKMDAEELLDRARAGKSR
jgi:serine/threonine protein kinase